jgi:hypothetical protein
VVVGSIKQLLRDKGMISLSRMDMADIAAILKSAREAAKSGSRTIDLPIFSRTNHAGTPVLFSTDTVFSRAALPATLSIDGKDRPATNSNGQPIHPTEEGVRNFWRWFGDSKVVDVHGRPLVVYHGGSSERQRFDKVGVRDAGWHGPGHYFYNNAQWAKGYGKVVKPYYLKISNPELRNTSDAVTGVGAAAVAKAQALLKDMQTRGKDGVLAYDEEGNPTSLADIVAFSPDQIRPTSAATASDQGLQFSRASSTAPRHAMLLRDWLASDPKAMAGMLSDRRGARDFDYELRDVPVADITPSQTGDDYLNASSQYTAQQIASETIDSIHRKEDVLPVILDENLKIIDGNHRHAASTLNGATTIPAIVRVGRGAGSIVGVESWLSVNSNLSLTRR